MTSRRSSQQDARNGAGGAPPPNGRRTYSFALLATLTTLFLVVVVAAGFALVGYDTSTAIETRALHDRFSLLYRGASDYLRQSVRAVGIAQRTMIVHLARDPLGPSSTALTREPYGALKAFTREFPMLTAAYVGYKDGAFVYYANLRRWSSALREAISAPEAAVSAIRHVGANGGESWWSFQDESGAEIHKAPIPPNSYDPRERPWYREAMAAPSTILTKPYLFATTRQLGMTIATKLPSGDGVVGADMTLDDIMRFALQLRVSPSSRVVLFTRDGWILGHGYDHKGDRPPATEAAAAPAPVRVADADNLLIDRLTSLGLESARSSGSVSEAGRSYLLQAAPIGEAVGTDLFLGVAAPVDEVDTGLHRQIVLASAVGVIGLVLGAVMAVLSARALSRPISRLGDQARRLAALDFTEPRPIRSRIAEVRDLADALERTRHALRIFGTYVPKQLVERLVRNPHQAQLAGERRRVSLMFTDIAGYSAIAERLDPDDLMAQTSAYFECIGQTIARHDGIIDKFIGDAVMALWNAPDPDLHHADNACRAALAVAAALGDFNRAAERAGKPPFQTRIGIHTGDCVVGNVGSTDRVGYTAMGAAVNLASRVEGLNGLYGTTILASSATVEAARPQFLFRWIDRVAPAGMTEGIEVYELLAERPAPGEPVDPRVRKLLGLWERAEAPYRAGRFAEAAEAFRAVAAAFPEDGPARLLADRCARFAAEGPPAGWTGTFQASAKKA